MGVLTAHRQIVGFVTITDSFNRADSTTTMGNTDTGQTWLYNAGTWGITANTSYCSTNATDSQNTAVVESSVADASVQVTLSTQVDNGVCFRSSDNNNYWLTSGNFGRLYKRVTGSFTLVATWSGGTDGDITKGTFSGSSITIYRNAISVATTTDTHNSTATRHGMRSADTTSRFDNFSVTVP